MTTPLRILLLGDHSLNAEQLRTKLSAGGIAADLTRVRSRDDFGRTLARSPPDLVLAAYSLPDFHGLAALDLVRGLCPEVPFIFVSGAIGEELVIEALRKGATDYVLETRLEHLAPAVVRALRQVEERVERRRAQRALRESEERYRALAEELAEVARRKDEFLAMLSHELRNPLAAIRNGLEILRLCDPSDPVLNETRQTVERQVRHLSRLADDLLDVFGISHGKLALRVERLDLAPLVRRVVRGYDGAAHDAGLALVLELPREPIWVVADPVRLAQVVNHLLHNAVKFTGADGKVTVRLESSGGQAVLSVRDTGIGIGPEDLPHACDDFAQFEPGYDRRRGGLGLGLALVKGIVELHGGTVRVTSGGRGAGVEVTVSVPLAPVVAPPPPLRADAAEARPVRILVVEDNRDAARTLQLLLRKYGFEVEVAYTGTAGVRAAHVFRPHVVLCDLGLPEMDGFDVARALRQDPATGAARLIAVSGFGQEEDRLRAYEAGFNVHLTKPVDPEELERVLEAQGAGACSRG
jgi:signal transduction histidine kinase